MADEEQQQVIPPSPDLESGQPTPISAELGGAPPLINYNLPAWNEIAQTPKFKQADADAKLKMLDEYTRQARSAARFEAERTQQDPNEYDKAIDNFAKNQSRKFEDPLSITANTAKAVGSGALAGVTSTISGLPLETKKVLAPELDLSYIGKMSVDDAKAKAVELAAQQPKLEEEGNAALDYLKNKPERVAQHMQDPAKYPMYPGGDVAALDAVQKSRAQQRTLDALNTYIQSNGTNAPQQTSGEAFEQTMKENAALGEQAIKVDEVYKRNHPILADAANSIGRIAPYVLSDIFTGQMEDIPAELIKSAVGISDAFQTSYQAAQAKIDERVRQGEQFSPYEREKLALDDASRASLSVGSFYAASNMILGGAMGGLTERIMGGVSTGLEREAGSAAFSKQNLLKYLLTGGIDTAAQIGIQGGATIAQNISDITSGVDPEKEWYSGLGRAAGTGLIWGVGGGLLRVAKTKLEDNRITNLANKVTDTTGKIMELGVPDLTHAQAFEMALHKETERNPNDRDAIRAKALNLAAAKDQANTADQIRDQNPETAKVLDQTSQDSANSPVKPPAGNAAVDRIKAMQDKLKAQKEADDQAKAEAAAKKTAEGGAPPPPTTPPTTTAAPGEEGKPEEEPVVAAVDQATRDQVRKEVNDKLNQLLGPDATAQDKEKLTKDYIERGIYTDPEMSQLQKRSGNQLLHDLGLRVQEKLPGTWKDNTPQSLLEMENHFSAFLDRQIAERAAAKVAPTTAAAPATAEGLTPPGLIIHPDVLKDAVAKNDPSELVRMLQEGHKKPLTDEELENEANDNFFLEHRDWLDIGIDKTDKHPFLRLAEGVPTAELPVAGEGIKKGEAERMHVGLYGNDPEMQNEIQALPAHPYEEEHLAKALRTVNGAGERHIDNQLNPAEKPDIEEIKTAAISSYHRALRRYTERMQAAGRENELTKPGEKAEEAPPEEEKAEPPATVPAEAPEEPGKLPNIWTHIKWTLLDYGDKRSKGLTIRPEKIVRLQAPLGVESHEATMENVAAAEVAKTAGAARAEAEAGAPETAELEAEAAKPLSTIAKDEVAAIGKDLIKDIAPKFQRIGWYWLRRYGFITEDEVPEGVKGATGIPKHEQHWFKRLLADRISKTVDARRGTEETPERVEPGHPGAGERGQPPPPGGGGAPAQAHVEPVPGRPELPGTETGRPVEKPGEPKRELPTKGQTAAGQPEGVLPTTRGAETGAGTQPGATPTREPGETAAGAGEPPGGAGGTTPATEAAGPAAAGGERATGPPRPRGPTAASRERTLIVHEKAPEGTGGPNPTAGGGTVPGRGSAGGTGLADIGQAGAAISQNMRDMLWDKFQKGDTTEAGGRSNLLLLAAREKTAGRITSRAEFDAYITRYGESLKANQPINEFAAAEAARKPAPAAITNKVQAWLGSLTAQEREAVDHWLAGRPEIRAGTDPKSAAWESAIAKAPIHEGTAFRGLAKQSDADIARLKAGNDIHNQHDSSASTDPQQAKDFSRISFINEGREPQEGHSVVLELNGRHRAINPEGSREIKIGVPYQKEVILPKGATYKVRQFLENHYGPNQHHVILDQVKPETAGEVAKPTEVTPLDIAKALMKRPEIAEDHGIEVGDFDNAQALADHLGELEGDHEDPAAWYREMASDLGIEKKAAPVAEAKPAEAAKPVEAAKPAEAPLPSNIGALSAHYTTRITAYMRQNPEIAAQWGLQNVKTPADLVRFVSTTLNIKDMPTLYKLLNQWAQKLGIEDPPHPPGGTAGSGTVRSMVPGIPGVHGFGGRIKEIIERIRASRDPVMMQFAKSLNAHQERGGNLPIRQIFAVTPSVFYHDGELHITASTLRHPMGEKAIAHEIQHAIAQQKITFPQTPDEHEQAAHWNHLADELRKRLPPDIRDNLEEFGPMFDHFEAGENLDTSQLTPEERKLLPVIYAAYKDENMLSAAFSNANFRTFLGKLKLADGRSMWQAVEHWGKTMFGDAAFKFADDAHPLVSDRPGIKMNSFTGHALTEGEKRARAMTTKYRFSEGVNGMLEAVIDHSRDEDIGIRMVASALQKVAEEHPGIKVSLEDRIGGFAGGYSFFGDHLTINPHYGDREIQQTILHELVHGYTVGKIEAFQTGQVHLLSAADCHAIIELNNIRQDLLKHSSVPKEIRQIAGLEGYDNRIKAFQQFADQNPEVASKYYGLIDLNEFASESLTNGELQDVLDKIPYREETGAKPRTALQKVFDWVRSFLGFKENTALSAAFDQVSRIMGGRRVMEADYQAGRLGTNRPLMQQENLLAKRYLDQRAQAEGFGDTRAVPIDRLNWWLREFRQGKGVSTRRDPGATFDSIGKPRSKGMIHASEQLSGLTHPADILNHLSAISGVNLEDIDSMHQVLEQAFDDRAITLPQLSDSMQALEGLSQGTLRRLHFDLGTKEDNKRMIDRWAQYMHLMLPEGVAPKGMKDVLDQHLTFERQATAYEIENRRNDLRKAVMQEYKTADPKKLPARVYEDINDMLEGKAPPRYMPTSIIEAADAMRASIASRGFDIVNEGFAPSEDKKAKIIDNLGKYVARQYRVFEDKDWQYRKESKQWRTAAEKEADTMLKGKSRTAEARRVAENAKADAERNFAPGSTAGVAAGRAAYSAAYADAMKNIGPHYIDRKMAEFLQIAQNKETKNLQFGHAYAINEETMKDLENIGPNMRRLMGEERDPYARYASTVWRAQNYLNANRVARDLESLGRQSGWLSDRMSKTNNTQVPAGFTHLGNLGGKWVTPEVAATLTAAQKNIEALHKGGPIMDAIRKMEGLARYTTTILSPMRSMANLHGVFFAHLNNGYWNPFDPGLQKGMSNVFASKLLRMNNEQREAYLMDLYRRGLSDKESDVNHLMEFIKSGAHINARSTTDLVDLFNTSLRRAKSWDKISEAQRTALELHTVWNFMSKASQYEQQIVRERRFNDWDVANRGAQRLSDDEIKNRAAQVVRETNISYSRASPVIRVARQHPFVGTFLTFWEQAMQSYAYSIGHAIKNLRSENLARKADGARRMGGLIAAAMIPVGLSALSKQLFGVSDQEDANFRKLLPPWEQHNAIFYGPKSADKKRAYWNMTYSNQQSDIARTINALLTQNNPRGIEGNILDALWESSHSLYNFGLVPGALVDWARNQTEYGAQVYNPNDTLGYQVKDVVGHILNRTFGGGLGRFGSKIIPMLQHGGEYVSPGGSVYNFETSVIPEMLGLNIKELSFPERFRSELYNSHDSIQNAERIFTDPIKRSGNELNDDQMASLYQRSEHARQGAFQELHMRVEAARFGGLSTKDIRGLLKARRFSSGEIEDIMRGKYRAYIPSKAVLESARKNGNHVPGNLFGKRTFLYEGEEEE